MKKYSPKIMNILDTALFTTAVSLNSKIIRTKDLLPINRDKGQVLSFMVDSKKNT